MRGRRFLVPLVLVAIVVACADDSGGESSTGSPLASATSVAGEEATASATDETTPTSTPATTSSTARPESTEPAVTADTTSTEPVDCDSDTMLAAADSILKRARLEAGGEWTTESAGTVFDGRTNSAEEFAHRVGSYDCSLRAAQTTPDGDERLLLAAWVGDRANYVLQATDAPRKPYATDINFQLMIESAYGEWLEAGFVWAGTTEEGDSIVVGAVDTSVALSAKSWPADVPRFEDLPVTLEVEQYAIDVLTDAGARNVSVAEPAGQDSEIGAIQFVTPQGLHLVATVAAPDWFSPDAELVPGEVAVESIGGVDVHVTRGEPDAYAVASVGWTCGDYVWFIDSVWGSVDELTTWAAELIAAGDCTS